MAAGANDSRSAALKSLNQRRDYGAQPSAACISKSTERALREEGRVQQPLRAAPGNELDALEGEEEEEDWGSEMLLEEGRAWKPQGRHSQQARMQQNETGPVEQQQRQQQHQPTGMQPHVSPDPVLSWHEVSGLTIAKQKSDQVETPQMPQPNRQQAAGRNSSTQHVHQLPGELQNKAVRQAVPAKRLAGNAETAVLSSDVDACQVLEAAGCSHKASSLMKGSDSLPFPNAVADSTADPDNAPRQGTAQGGFDGMRLPESGHSLCHMQTQPALPDTAADHGRALVVAAQDTAGLVDGQTALCMSSIEQSDYELALRLQAQEHAMHHQHSQPVMSGRGAVKQKQRQTSGTLHAFFRKA